MVSKSDEKSLQRLIYECGKCSESEQGQTCERDVSRTRDARRLRITASSGSLLCSASSKLRSHIFVSLITQTPNQCGVNSGTFQMRVSPAHVCARVTCVSPRRWPESFLFRCSSEVLVWGLGSEFGRIYEGNSRACNFALLLKYIGAGYPSFHPSSIRHVLALCDHVLGGLSRVVLSVHHGWNTPKEEFRKHPLSHQSQPASFDMNLFLLSTFKADVLLDVILEFLIGILFFFSLLH